jgi:hypothetical protein
MIPPFVRMAPDYFDSDGFIEVMGFGTDQTIKLKDVKHEVLQDYQAIWPVRIFLWDSFKKRWSIAPLSAIETALFHEATKAQFHDGPTYFALAAEHWPGEWTDFDPNA